MIYNFNLHYIIFYIFALFASVAELVDALDSKSSSLESVGSIPTRSTTKFKQLLYLQIVLCQKVDSVFISRYYII